MGKWRYVDGLDAHGAQNGVSRIVLSAVGVVVVDVIAYLGWLDHLFELIAIWGCAFLIQNTM